MGALQFGNSYICCMPKASMPKERSKKEMTYRFHGWKKQLLVADKTISILTFLLIGIFSPDYVLIVSYFLLILYLVLTRRNVLLQHLAIASLLAFLWVIAAKDQYAYNQDFITVLWHKPIPCVCMGLWLVFSVSHLLSLRAHF